MGVAERLLQELRDEGVRVWVRDGRLRVGSSQPLDADRSAALRRNKADLLELLRDADVTRSTPPATLHRPGPAPLTTGQEGLWFLDQMEADGAYDVRSSLLLRGVPDVPALARAVADLSMRHDVLRTRYPSADGVPTQVVDDAPAVLRTVDLIDATVEDALVAASAGPFDLEGEVPFRVMLVRLAPEEHVLVIDAHHLVLDGPSVGILSAELDLLYRAHARGEEPGLAPLLARYGDHARWQRAYLRGAVLEDALGYWRDRLAGAEPVLDLPLDRPRPTTPTHVGDIVAFTLPAELTRALAEVGRREDATPFMVLLAAFQVVLARWAGQDDVCVGLPVDDRPHQDVAGLVGYFLNTVVLRSNLSERPTFAELLRQVRRHTVDAYDRRSLPFDRLVADLAPERVAGCHPLFQVLFTHLGDDRPVLGDLDVDRVEGPERTAKFDLTLFAVPTDDGTDCGFEFATDVFDRASIERLAGVFRLLLEAVVADPGTRVDELNLLSGGDRDQVVSGWNDTGRPDTVPLVPQAWSRAAAATPGAPALEFEGTTVTYGELDDWVGRLAGRLRERGVGPEEVVVVRLPRSPELVVALLAVHRAGGAYLPLDVDCPAERAALMVADAAPVVVLDEPGTVTACRTGAGGSLPAGAVPVHPGSAAYVIYTSGSTGRPKGVLVSHGAIANRIAWGQAEYGLTPGDRLLQKTPASFDVSVPEFFWPLTAGATMVLARSEGHRDPQYLRGLLETSGITHAHFVPSMLTAFLDVVVTDGMPSQLRRVFCSGEALAADLVHRFAALAPGVELHNLYGPTEAAVEVTSWAAAPAPDTAAGVVPIGRPVWNTQVYVLDGDLCPVPPGVVGELFLSGVQLARGYVGQAGLTAERFVPNPFRVGERMYRTGDVARWSGDGVLRFLGRSDDQVKVRGVRVELGEVESVLGRCPGVRACAVVAVARAQGDLRLVGYVVPDDPAAHEVDMVVHSRLSAQLPGPAMPSALVVIGELPLTPSGKLDRKALAARGLPERVSDPAGVVGPRDAAEQVLVQQWQEVLDLERVGVHEDFFGLGGHSLLATRLVARIRQHLGVELTMRDFFAAPTIARLAAVLPAAPAAVGEVLERSPRTGPRPMSFAQRRMWFLDQLGSQEGRYNVPAAWRLTGRLDLDALRAALDGVVARHEVLRSTFDDVDGVPVQIARPAAAVELPVADLTGSAEPEQALVRLLEQVAAEPFDLTRELPIRCRLVVLGPRHHVLSVVLHHIVADGWSLEVLLDELTRLYRAHAGSMPADLPELPVQYADHAEFEDRRLDPARTEEHLGYWRRYLDGAPRSLDLPADHPRPAVATSRGGTVAFGLGTELSDGLRELAARHGATLSMTLAAAYAVLLHRVTAQDDVCIGYTVGSRDRVEIEGLIGLFVNTLVLRSTIGRATTFADALAGVRTSMLDADEHRALPFEKVVEELRPERDLSRHPVFQAAYNYGTTHGSAAGGESLTLVRGGRRIAALPDVELRPVEYEVHTSKFDLSLFVSDTGAGQPVGCAFEYSSDVLDRTSVDWLAEVFRSVLAGVVADTGTGLADLELLSEGGRHRVVSEWNATDRPEALPGSCPLLPDRFAEQVRTAPDAPALELDGVSLTYGELDARVGRLAGWLRGHGVGPEAIVLVRLPRSVELVVALLAVHQAGGAYLPVDVDCPPERVAVMAADAEPIVVLDDIAVVRGAVLRGAGDDVAPVAADLHPGSAAYVIYTSGSTGRPKGVLVSHAAIANRIAWMQAEYGLRPGEKVLQKTPASFDVSVWEFFWPLSVGATLVVARSDGHRDPHYLADVLAGAGVSTVHFVPSMLAQFLDALAGSAPPPRLRRVVCSGEALPAEVAERFGELLPGVELHNLYGPTEAAVDVTAWPIVPGAGVVPIGRPVWNTQVYVLDGDMCPVPPGVVGELFLSGVQLARGYVGQAGLTAERFVPNPFRVGERMYRTGDVARWSGDGVLRFLGRSDDQVKVRGVRVELGEVESVLGRCPGVRACAVAADGTGAGVRLMGYVVPAAGADPPDDVALLSHLRSRLPEAMVPSTFVRLDDLPLTSSGKCDRRALPSPTSWGTRSGGPPVAPSTEAERAVAEAWRALLGLDEVGVHDDFFDLGGHSLLVVEAARATAGALGVEVRPRILFEFPTIAGITAFAETRVAGEI